MQKSNHALTHLGGECANDDDYAFTPSGVRTRVAVKATPEGVVLPLSARSARMALQELAVADDLRDEEPTAEWLDRWPNLRSWDEANGRAPVSPPALPPTSPSQDAIPKQPRSLVELDPLDLEDADEQLLAERWMLATDQATPVPAADYVSAWLATPDRSLSRRRSSPSEWSLATWLTVGAAVLIGELFAMIAALL